MIAVGQFTIYDFHDVHSSPTAPTNPVKDMVWLDTSVKPPLMRVWDGKAWVLANDFTTDIEDAKNEVIKKVESQIAVTEKGILQKVSETYASKKDVTSEVDKVVNDIKIGVRNIVIGTKEDFEMTGNNTSHQCNRAYYFVNKDGRPLKGQKFVCSFYYEVSEGASGTFKIQTDGSYSNPETGGMWAQMSPGIDVVSKPSGFVSYKSQFPSDDLKGFKGVQVRLDGFNGTIRIYKFMTVLGTKSGDWQQALEDFESVIDSVNSSLKEEIKNSVSGLQDQSSELLDRIEDAFSDNVLSSYEKMTLQSDLKIIDSQYDSMKVMVTEFNDSAVTGQFNSLTSRHKELHDLLDPLLVDLNTATEMSNAVIRESLYQYQLQYNITFVALQTLLDSRLNTLTTTVNTTAQGIETAITKSNSALNGVETIGKHFNFTDSGWVEIFSSINGKPGRFKAQITDQRFSFLDNNSEVAYLSNRNLYITEAQILNALQIGNVSLSKTAKGGLIFQWKG